MTKKLYFWLIIALIINGLAFLGGNMRKRNNDYWKLRADEWRETAEKQKETIDLYETAAQSCSFVVSNHIQILEGFRDMQVQAQICGNKVIPLPQRYNFNITQLEKSTPVLSSQLKDAREAAKKSKLPVFAY